MRLRKLVLRDFGLYRGEQSIDLSPRTKYGRQRPVILVGGHNGAGKTTILDAVRLCLYGRLALGVRVTDAEYSGYLRDRIHRDRDSLIQPTSAAVTVEFDYSRAGETATYIVRRSWEPKGTSSVHEQLDVLRNSQPLDDVESQFWPDFIRSLIPPGVSQLFFFDGEKIKRLAEGHTESEALAESVKALLGLDLVERLQTDLDIYCAREIKKTADGEAGAKLADFIERQHALTERREQLSRQEKELATKLQLLNIEIERAEQGLAQRGEGLSTQRHELRERRTELDAKASAAREMLREISEGALPLLMCPKLCGELLAQLETEGKLALWNSSHNEIARALKKAEQHLLSSSVASKLGLGPFSKAALAAELTKVSKELAAKPKSLKSAKILHGFSDTERAQIMRLMDEALEALPKRVKSVTKDLARNEEELRIIHAQLSQVPDKAELTPFVKKLSALQAQHGTFVAEMAQLAEQRSEVDNELAAVGRAKDRLLATQADARSLGNRVAMAHKARAALDLYLAKLTEAKAAELQGVVLECFRRICRKTDLVTTLHIDPRTFEVTLKDRNGHVVPREALSAGEKQMFAIALLWALARVSGRPLPMIIDTPLGRLDSVHRRKLVEHYFPNASHQVIVLSTDTEVDREYFTQLRPSISHTVALDNHGGEWTEARTGYFWTEETNNDGSPT
jgi:DNA sulfur modification protein DndD